MTTPARPSVTANVVGANTVVENDAQRVLFVAQKNGGTATSGALVKSIGNDLSVNNALFGADAQISAMIRGYKSNNKESRLDVISLDDAGGATAAGGLVVFTGTATEAGTINVTVGSKLDNTYEIAVASGATAASLGILLETAITADLTAPADGVDTAGSVALTAVNGGTEGNAITILIEGEVAGITVTVTGFSGGATNPTLTTLFDVIGEERYQTIVIPASWGLTELKALLDPRWNVTDEIQDGVGVISVTDTLSNLKALGDAENSQNITILGQKIVNTAAHKGSSLVELDYVVAAKFAAVRALRMTDGANIADIVVADSVGPLDATGGPAIASLPYANTLVGNLPVIEPANGFAKPDIASLKVSGVSVIGNNKSKTAIVCGEIMTTYKTDIAGNPDQSFQYLNYTDTSSQAREYIFNNLEKQFAQVRLTDGNLVSRRAMANAPSIKGFIVELKQDLSGEDFVLLREGPAIDKAFKDALIVTLDLLNGKATVTGILPIVTQLREINATLQLNFSVE